MEQEKIETTLNNALKIIGAILTEYKSGGKISPELYTYASLFMSNQRERNNDGKDK